MKERMVELNKTINWKPKSTGEGRFGNWLENMVDWNLSRSRFWGTPLPIWRTADGSVEKCIGSIEELNNEIKKANQVLGSDINRGYLHEGILDLHKPYVDEIILVSDDGEHMKRVPDLIDVWFDSGAMPYAQWHFPFENRDMVQPAEGDAKAFPADFIAEGDLHKIQRVWHLLFRKRSFQKQLPFPTFPALPFQTPEDSIVQTHDILTA